jgi:photosystem II stability/assembly factor-like uncharacterized protein
MKHPTTLQVACTTAAALGLVPFASAASSAMAPKASWYWTMAVAPSSPNVLVLGTSSGLFRSSNGGKSWRHVGPGDFNATSVAETGTTILAAGVKQPPTALPTVTKHGDYAVAPGPGLFVASHDGGLTWHALEPSGLPAVDVQALAVDPANASTVVAVLSDGALYRSTDDAASFTELARKVGGPPWAVTVTARGGLAAGNMTTGSYVSADGKVWHLTPFHDASGRKMAMEYATQPSDPNHVLMTTDGVMSSNNGGMTWHAVLRSKVMFGPVAWAPGSGTAYAVGFDRSLWRSVDGGRSWTLVSG